MAKKFSFAWSGLQHKQELKDQNNFVNVSSDYFHNRSKKARLTVYVRPKMFGTAGWWLLLVQSVLVILCSNMHLAAQSSERKMADAYADELKLLNSQRTAILKDASILIQQNNQLFQRAMAAQANAMRSAAVVAATPDYSLNSRTVVPPKNSSSSSSSNSRNKDAYVETTATSNLGFKSQMAVESNLWSLQSQMNMAAMQQVNAVFSKVVQRLVINLNGYCQATDIYGKRCPLEAEVAKELTTAWLTDDPEDTGAMLIRAAALRSLGEIDAAKDLALKAKQLSTPARPLAIVLLAQCLYLQGNSAEARTEILIANRLAQGTQFEEPAVVAALLNLADGKLTTARDSLQKVTRINRSSAYPLALLALVDSMRPPEKSTLKTVTQFMDEQKKQAARNNHLVMEIEIEVHAQQGDFDAAIVVAKELLKSASESEMRRYTELVAACERRDHKFDGTQYIKSRWLFSDKN